MRKWLGKYAVRYALSVTVAVALAEALTHLFAGFETGWMALTAFLVCQTTRGTPVRQGMLVLFAILLLSVLAALLYPLVQEWMLDVLIGGAIGILCSQLILPVKPFAEFSQGLLPLLRSLISFNVEIANLLLDGNGYVAVQLAVNDVLKMQQMRYSLYPEWVYEVGFNPGLRVGYRFFLINLERISEVVSSLGYRMQLLKDNDALLRIASSLRTVVLRNNLLLQQLETYFSLGEFGDAKEDFTSDMAALDVDLQQVLPAQLGLMDIYPDNISIAMIVRDIKDMRQLLLQLVLAATTKQIDHEAKPI